MKEKFAKLLDIDVEDVIPVEESDENLFCYYAIQEHGSITKLVTYDRLNNEIVAEKDVADLLD